MNSTDSNWKEAYDACMYEHNATQAITHLIAFESLAETISFSFWFKGNKYTNSFWSDLVLDDENKRIWSWSSHIYHPFGYMKENFTSLKKTKAFLRNNNSATFDYEINDDSGMAKMGYICEAQLKCNVNDNQCQNNGTCFINSGRVLCTCEPGYQGSLCEIMVDNCNSVPCLHGASCYNKVNNYTCECTPFYRGRNCEIEIPNALEDGRKSALAISVSILGLILLVLCLMDLPWSSMKKILCDRSEAKKNENNEYANQQKNRKIKEEKKLTKEQLVATDEEILKKFKLIMAQNNVRKTQNSISPAF
ncbi:protocadherin Fat 1 isoform X1 [Brachionus plicatilis]|uniref:Protocadherin Fat 1 isoform X1 n=1 Tax=Brachionus plicatilis TaxID=10195 RepID=A0A3M7S064_BRAPC|nr:protocadherin Fat 1 isoform X1 [Brachionus plicatilis]